MNAQISTQSLRSGTRPRPNHIRHHLIERTVETISRLTAGPRALIEARYGKRQAVVLMLGSIPSILALILLTVPAFLFPTPEHRAFYQFAWSLTHEPVSFLPMLIGIVTLALCLRIPLEGNAPSIFTKGA